jgi:hypothetical protein
VPGDRIDALIVAATAGTSGGDFAHCGVVERVEVSPGDGAIQLTTIEALSRSGVTRQTFPLPPQADAARALTFAHCAAQMEPHRVAYALAWAGRQVGAPYGWLDIAADVLKALLPHALGSRTPFLVSPSALDCSELCARYLLVAGYEWLPDAVVAAPEQVSPNDLGRLLGVLKL